MFVVHGGVPKGAQRQVRVLTVCLHNCWSVIAVRLQLGRDDV